MATGTLPDWITDQQAERGPGRFLCDDDAHFPEIIADLRAHGYEVTTDPLDQYWLHVLTYICVHDATMAVSQSGLARHPDGRAANKWLSHKADHALYGNSLDPQDPHSGRRGWLEFTEVEIVPDRECKKGETVEIDGVPHVCIEEMGCRKQRDGSIESGRFRREVFNERPVGKGMKQAAKDSREIFVALRGYKPA